VRNLSLSFVGQRSKLRICPRTGACNPGDKEHAFEVAMDDSTIQEFEVGRVLGEIYIYTQFTQDSLHGLGE
jgi:hypothetical protein